ncbi:hypothetical protein [Haloarcula litorea]|uniref:hypothetical protein n=1 Tax=Haloarcula litorea TaxID=3032579 RepID=UPI0023E79E3A|nr:hypothetical protein [Halomicroarcula sp. GDY20]
MGVTIEGRTGRARVFEGVVVLVLLAAFELTQAGTNWLGVGAAATAFVWLRLAIDYLRHRLPYG